MLRLRVCLWSVTLSVLRRANLSLSAEHATKKHQCSIRYRNKIVRARIFHRMKSCSWNGMRGRCWLSGEPKARTEISVWREESSLPRRLAQWLQKGFDTCPRLQSGRTQWLKALRAFELQCMLNFGINRCCETDRKREDFGLFVRTIIKANGPSLLASELQSRLLTKPRPCRKFWQGLLSPLGPKDIGRQRNSVYESHSRYECIWKKNRSSLHEEIIYAPRLGRMAFWSCPWLHVHKRLLASNIEVTVIPLIALFVSAVELLFI